MMFVNDVRLTAKNAENAVSRAQICFSRKHIYIKNVFYKNHFSFIFVFYKKHITLKYLNGGLWTDYSKGMMNT